MEEAVVPTVRVSITGVGSIEQPAHGFGSRKISMEKLVKLVHQKYSGHYKVHVPEGNQMVVQLTINATADLAKAGLLLDEVLEYVSRNAQPMGYDRQSHRWHEIEDGN